MSEFGFRPSQVWDPDSADFEVEEAILRARDEMNRENPDELLSQLTQKSQTSKRSGVITFVGHKAEDYSKTDGLVLFDSYAMGIEKGRLTRPEFVRRVLYHAGVRDKEGLPLPVLFIPSPGLRSFFKSWVNARAIRKGEFGHFAQPRLKAVESMGIGRISLMGHSQGASVAIAAARRQFSPNFDIEALIADDPVNVERRKIREFSRDFRAATDRSQAREANDLKAQLESVDNRGMAQFLITAVFWPSNSLVMLPAMTKNRFDNDVKEVITEGRTQKLVVAYGAQSEMAVPILVESSLWALSSTDDRRVLTSICIESADHTWVEDYRLVGKTALMGFKSSSS